MCLAWGFLIPLGVVIACFRTVRGMGTWWFHLHRALQILGFLVSLAGLAVGVYLDPGQGGLFWQHKIIGITVNVLALVQVRLYGMPLQGFAGVSPSGNEVHLTSHDILMVHCYICQQCCWSFRTKLVGSFITL